MSIAVPWGMVALRRFSGRYQDHEHDDFLDDGPGTLDYLTGTTTHETVVGKPSPTGVQIGAYRVCSRIGAGGMGEVWAAEHVLLGRRAAIKLLRPEYSSRPEIVTRFFNEAKAATAIADPGIVQIFDFGYTNGSAYIVMELLEGETLGARCQRIGALPFDEALRIVRQVATALGSAHDRGIVHRDLKPDNIFLTRDVEVVGSERAKILDFGIAKLSGDSTTKTQTLAVMGTPPFMSPEQCRGAGTVDARSDVYALGCVLFTVLAGRLVFDADGPGDIMAMQLREQAPLLSSVRDGVSLELDALIARCLDKDPEKRFQSAVALAKALSALPATPKTHQTPPAAQSTFDFLETRTFPSIEIDHPHTRRVWAQPQKSSSSSHSLSTKPLNQHWLVPSLIGVVITAALSIFALSYAKHSPRMTAGQETTSSRQP